jgi:hypothetical protein
MGESTRVRPYWVWIPRCRLYTTLMHSTIRASAVPGTYQVRLEMEHPAKKLITVPLTDWLTQSIILHFSGWYQSRREAWHVSTKMCKNEVGACTCEHKQVLDRWHMRRSTKAHNVHTIGNGKVMRCHTRLWKNAHDVPTIENEYREEKDGAQHGTKDISFHTI